MSLKESFLSWVSTDKRLILPNIRGERSTLVDRRIPGLLRGSIEAEDRGIKRILGKEIHDTDYQVRHGYIIYDTDKTPSRRALAGRTRIFLTRTHNLHS